MEGWGGGCAAVPLKDSVLEMLDPLKSHSESHVVLKSDRDIGLILIDCLCQCPHSSMSVSSLEPELQERIREISPQTTTVYFNKGL